MNISQIETNLTHLTKDFNKKSFVFDLLLAYGIPKNTIALLKKGDRNLSKRSDQIILKKKLFFQEEYDEDLHSTIENLCNDEATFQHDPRFIIVTDYKTLLAVDVNTDDTLDINIKNIHKYFDFFLPWAGMEKAQHKSENPADIKAAEKMAKLYDEILKDNQYNSKEELHRLNKFLSRLLFCFFAEDTGIFSSGIFTLSVSSHTNPDGSDLSEYLNKLFKFLNTKDTDRNTYPKYLKNFPYVNGGLFGDTYYSPQFTRKSRSMIIECGELDWSAINPDIFGSMIQAVVHTDQRGGMGIHYTSVPNIMKVIEPLFINELYELFNKSYDDSKRLESLLHRLYKIKIFDPACGSGNFLIIAYKEIRKLEINILKRLKQLNKNNNQLSLAMTGVLLSQFYGIELDDFAHEVAILSLWLAEHQMNIAFKEEIGAVKPSLPLAESGNIVCENSLHLDWNKVCPSSSDDEVYILGNPPYLGSRKQDENHKEDLKIVFKEDYKSLDYISAWFYKGSRYISGKINCKCAFVSTNSICQGEQVALTWPRILGDTIEIDFAYTGFKWTNNARSKAAVIVIIVGLRNTNNRPHFLYRNGIKSLVKSINPYLVEGSTIYIHERSTSISNLPEMNFGNMPADGGKLLLNANERKEIISEYPASKKWIKPLISAKEFLNSIDRWCIWLVGITDDELNKNPKIKKRVSEVKKIRLESSRPKLASIPHLFAQITQPANQDFIIIPRHSSENREYIPIGYYTSSNIAHDSCLMIANPEIHHFGILTSKMHMAWVKAIAGRIKTDFRYSKDIVYNNFPIPQLNKIQMKKISECSYKILEERERYSDKTLAELYNTSKMPLSLKNAHHNLDMVVDKCYSAKPFTTDEERLDTLFKLYESLINIHKDK